MISCSFTTLPCALPLLSKTGCQGDVGADKPTSAHLTSTQQNYSFCSRECGRSWLESTTPQKGSGRLLPRRSSPPPSASGTSDVTSGFGLAANISKKGNKRTPCLSFTVVFLFNYSSLLLIPLRAFNIGISFLSQISFYAIPRPPFSQGNYLPPPPPRPTSCPLLGLHPAYALMHCPPDLCPCPYSTYAYIYIHALLCSPPLKGQGHDIRTGLKWHCLIGPG
jgi:hypothetical protein